MIDPVTLQFCEINVARRKSSLYHRMVELIFVRRTGFQATLPSHTAKKLGALASGRDETLGVCLYLI